MRALLDVNVLIAMHDASHVHHDRARAWLREHLADGWASCPLTQAGFVRILAQPRYPLDISAAGALELLRTTCASPHHEFWPADVPLTDAEAIHAESLLGPSQVTDLYLLALAVRHGGRLVTFDATITPRTVPGADASSLVVLT